MIIVYRNMKNGDIDYQWGWALWLSAEGQDEWAEGQYLGRDRWSQYVNRTIWRPLPRETGNCRNQLKKRLSKGLCWAGWTCRTWPSHQMRRIALRKSSTFSSFCQSCPRPEDDSESTLLNLLILGSRTLRKRQYTPWGCFRTGILVDSGTFRTLLKDSELLCSDCQRLSSDNSTLLQSYLAIL